MRIHERSKYHLIIKSLNHKSSIIRNSLNLPARRSIPNETRMNNQSGISRAEAGN